MSDFYVNFAERGPIYQDVDSEDLEILDTTSPTSVTEFIKLFAEDKSFSPPEASMVFDSDISEISIDDDVAPELSYDFEEADEDYQTRAHD